MARATSWEEGWCLAKLGSMSEPGAILNRLRVSTNSGPAVWTCYKAFKRVGLEAINLRENQFGIEQEITIKVAKHGWRVYEVPISYYGRTYAEGGEITWKDGARSLSCILRYSLTKAKPIPAQKSQAVTQPATRTRARTAD